MRSLWRESVARAASLGAAFLVVALAGCVSTSQPVSPRQQQQEPPPPPDPNSEKVNAERRAKVRLELAALYFGRGQAQTALDELKLALAADPNVPEAYTLRGLIYASLGDARTAEESFQRALQINPADADALHNYGWFLCQNRRYPEADALFQRAAAVPQRGESPRTLLARGVCQARAGQWAEAERTLSHAYELDPTNPTTAYNLSDVLRHRGEYERARFYVRRINQVPEQVSAQSLWLAARIERRIGNVDAMKDFGRQLVDRFPQSPEALAYERGRFDD